MTEREIFERTKDAYLSLIHPNYGDAAFQEKLAVVTEVSSSVPNELIADMITGTSWRERLLGLCLAMSKQPCLFVEQILQSLRDVRGISIVPACAVLAVLARRDAFTMPESFSEMFDRTAFDGEVGWATDKAMHFAGLRVDDVAGRGPNYGQIFENHVEMYSSITSQS